MELVSLAPVAFSAIALVFSMLGTGGAVRYTPILYWLGMDLATQAVPLDAVERRHERVGCRDRRTFGPDRPDRLAGVAMVVFAPLGALATNTLS